jgi:hypothetical protein
MMFEALDGAYQRREPRLPLVRKQPIFDPYRADPRFQAMLHRMNLAENVVHDPGMLLVAFGGD